MTQLIIDGVKLPEAPFDGYACWEETLSAQVDMISGRRVIETRGKVWKVTYSSDYIEDALLRSALAVLRGGKPITCQALPDDADEMVVSQFVVESVTQPRLLALDGGKPVWHGLGLALREERPHKGVM